MTVVNASITLTPAVDSLRVQCVLPAGTYGFRTQVSYGNSQWVDSNVNAWRDITLSWISLGAKPGQDVWVRLVFTDGRVSQTVKTTVGTPLPPPPPKIAVGIVNASTVNSWLPAITSTCLSHGLNQERLDIGDGSDLTQLDKSIALGFTVLPMFNPANVASLSLAQIRTLISALISKLVARGIFTLEFINEPYFNGLTASAYSTLYAGVHDLTSAAHIKLVAFAWGDYFNGSVWSKDGANGGWIRDFIRAGIAPDMWTCHPYPPGSVVTAVANEHNGWPVVANWRQIALSMGSTAPWIITEVGLKVHECGGLAGQASRLTEMVNDLTSADPNVPGTPYDFIQAIYWYGAIDDPPAPDGTLNDWGLFMRDGQISPGSSRPAFDALVTWKNGL